MIRTDATPLQGIPTASPIDDVRAKLGRLEQLEHERAGAAKTLRVIWSIIGGLVIAAAVAFGGWVWTLHGSTVETAAQLERVSEGLDEHARRGGVQGHPDSVIARTTVNEQRIASLERSRDMLEAQLERLDAKLDTIIERLPRSRRDR